MVSSLSGREFELGINGIDVQSRDRTIIVGARSKLRVLSSAVLNGGFVDAKSIINHQVPKNWKNSDPEKFLRKVISRLNVPEPVVGMMTAVNVRNLSTSFENTGVKVVAIVTAGISHPVSAGDEIIENRTGAGTINTILLIDGNLTDGAMVEAIKISTEAKVLKLNELGVRSIYSGEAASGTPTDSIAVGITGNGKVWRYSGSATFLGIAIARATKKGLEAALAKGRL